MSEDDVTIEDLREGDEHDQDESDMDVVFNEFERIIGGIKAASFLLQSKKDLAGAIESLRDTILRATDLQSAVLAYMADVEAAEGEDDEEEQDEDEDEDEDEDSAEVAPSSSDGDGA